MMCSLTRLRLRVAMKHPLHVESDFISSSNRKKKPKKQPNLSIRRTNYLAFASTLKMILLHYKNWLLMKAVSHALIQLQTHQPTRDISERVTMGQVAESIVRMSCKSSMTLYPRRSPGRTIISQKLSKTTRAFYNDALIIHNIYNPHLIAYVCKSL